MSQRRIAVAQYPIDHFPTFGEFRDKLHRWVEEGIRADAELLVFPEYGSMELASLFPEEVQKSLPGQLSALQELLPEFLELHRELARQNHLHILASSFPVRVGERYVNRAHLFTPNGEVAYQDKCIMTRFENEQWGISAGDSLQLFDTSMGKLGVTICYDVEFPLLTRSLVEAGAELILAPSCTDTDAGYHRVRIGAQARALENQCHVAQAVTVGKAEWSEAVDVNMGAAALYTPVDQGFPANGIEAIGEREQPQWVVATVRLQQARKVREQGQVFNHRDWPNQLKASARVQQVSLK